MSRSDTTTSDEEIAKLDRPGIWMRAWEVRGTGSDSPADIRRARALIRRWETLTGRRYYGTMADGITGYEVREDVLDDGTPIFDVYQVMVGDSEYVESYHSEEQAMRHARICAEDNGLGAVDIKVYRKE